MAALAAASLISLTLFPTRSGAQDESAPTQTVGIARLTPEAEASIKKGLAYLAKGGSQNPVAETSVGLMAFMLKGYVPGRGEEGRVMDKAISYLINKGREQRGFMGTPNNHAGMYEHGLAVLALSEAWGQSKNSRLKTALRRAVDVILRAQNAEGGWRYNPEPRDADLSMTVMHVVALNSAREAGISVPDATIEKAAKYVLSCQDEDSGGFRYQPGGGEPGFARTAAGVMSLILSLIHI